MGMQRSWPRVIVHADMDAFYASIEQLDDPSLRGRPVIVGPPSARGVVLTASYEARPFGVGSAMPMVEARRLCPQALVVPPRFERYRDVSKCVMAVFADFSPDVEPLSLDEAFIDVSGSEKILGAPERIGLRLKQAVREATGGLTVSVGISGTKYVAKVASGYRKPDGLTIVPPDEMRAWLAPLPVSQLWGAGPKTQAKLRELGFETIGDLAARSPDELRTLLGNTGLHFHELALARDPRRVDGSRPPKSMGSECTLETNIESARDVAFYLRRAAEKVGKRLRNGGYVARSVRVKLKRADFRLLARQRSLGRATDVADDLYRAALDLLPAFGPLRPMRLVGLAAFDLERRDAAPQADLLSAVSGRKRALEVALDRLEQRFGAGIVERASVHLGDRSLDLGSDLDYLRNAGEGQEE
ncbi:MAG TPA: DNA polymerase IV [Gammaproteobacteria bacterium]|nr:DNA polymerase IV [Gammaproteobacteria bacterium]